MLDLKKKQHHNDPFLRSTGRSNCLIRNSRSRWCVSNCESFHGCWFAKRTYWIAGENRPGEFCLQRPQVQCAFLDQLIALDVNGWHCFSTISFTLIICNLFTLTKFAVSPLPYKFLSLLCYEILVYLQNVISILVHLTFFWHDAIWMWVYTLFSAVTHTSFCSIVGTFRTCWS